MKYYFLLGFMTLMTSGCTLQAWRVDLPVKTVTATPSPTPGPFQGVVSTIAGSLYTKGTADGSCASATLGNKEYLASDNLGNVYMSDPINHIIRKLTLTGEIITLSGKAGETGSLDGMGVNARFNTPMGIAVDHANNIYVADNGSQTIRKILPSGLVVTIAGAPGELGSDDGNSSVARFYSPIGIAIDSRDNLFILDDHDKSVRKISTDGFVSTFVGATGYPSHMSNPRGIAIDQLNNIYITDQSTIMKISPDGNDATIAGSYNQKGYTDGSGASAGFNFLEGIAVDSSNNLYVTDSGNNMIKLINPEGQVTTIAGLPGISNHRDGPATNALFWVPTGITVDSSGNVFVTEGYPTIRKITPLK